MRGVALATAYQPAKRSVLPMTNYELINIMFLVAGGVILPVACLFEVFLRPSRVYAVWTKLAVIVICLAALTWLTLSWILLKSRSVGLTRETYDKLVGIRGWFAGVYFGIVFTIWLARPYRKSVEKQENAQSFES